MEDTPRDSSNQEMYLFQYLVVMFQNLAMQQMGKLINPITGKLERDLQQARITIDMIQMIKKKTAGNLHEEEQRLIDHVLMELQMNYVDEAKRAAKEPLEEETEQAVSAETGSEPPATAAESGDSEERNKGTPKKKSPAPKKKKAKKTAKRSKAGRKKKKDE